MAAAAADRFSGVPDELLVRVISFLPIRDAARTSILSRRWRSLWLCTGALNLDSRCYGQHLYDIEPLFDDASAVLRAPGHWLPVRKLSLFVEEYVGSYLRYQDNNMMDALLAEQALRRLEELRVGFKFSDSDSQRYVYELCPSDLPAAHTLHVLDLTWCRLNLPPDAGAAFPRLASLRLDRCSMPMHQLEALTRAAPSLAILHIEHQDFDFYCLNSPDDTGSDRLALHCPNLTALTLADLAIHKPMEVFAPRLCTFSYSGKYTEFSIKSEATNLTRVNLNFRSDADLHFRSDVEQNAERQSFLLWQFFGSLHNTKALKLHVPNIKDLVVDKDKQDGHLAMFHSLERLELKAAIEPDSWKDPAAAIAMLLQCCPVMCDFQLRLSRMSRYWWGHDLGNESRVEPSFDESMDLFKRRTSKEVALMLDGDHDSSGVADLPELTDCWFNCLHNHLKHVKLQFQLKELNSFEVCLAKFFAENCKVLEVLQIDDGDQNFLSHINRKVERWRLNALQRSDRQRIAASSVSRNKI